MQDNEVLVLMDSSVNYGFEQGVKRCVFYGEFKTHVFSHTKHMCLECVTEELCSISLCFVSDDSLHVVRCWNGVKNSRRSHEIHQSSFIEKVEYFTDGF
jgi:hypothetical protein